MFLCLGTTPALQRTMTFNPLALDEVNRAIDVRVNASGKSINVARVLKTLGERATATGFLGGISGKWMRDELDAAEIDHQFVDIPATTRTCVTLIDRSSGSVTELVEEAPAVGAKYISALLAKFKSLLRGSKFAVLSGSLAPGVGDDFYARCCKAANAAGVRVILDARGAALRNALRHRPMIVKINRAELADTVGMATDTSAQLRKAMAKLLKSGPEWAVVTMGSRGAVASDGKVLWNFPAMRIKVVSPIGSGDAFAAGLAAGVSRGQSVPEACRLATACAAANALIAGSGIVRLVDVKRLLRRVSFTSRPF